MDLKKAGSKKQGHCYSKREEAAWPLLFLNNNDPVFCNLLFSGPYFFHGHKPTHVLKTRIVGADYLGEQVIGIYVYYVICKKLVGQIQAVPRLSKLFSGLLPLSEIYFSHFTKSESILDFVRVLQCLSDRSSSCLADCKSSCPYFSRCTDSSYSSYYTTLDSL